jgi:hypothetical protein
LFQIIKRLTIAKEILDLVSMDEREREREREKGGGERKDLFMCI